MRTYQTTPWLSLIAADAMRRAARQALAQRLDARFAAREVAWGHYPALPARMIDDAVTAVVAGQER